MANNTVPQAPVAKQSRGSAAGFILAFFSLILAAIGSGLVHAHFKPAHPTTSKVANAVASGTGHAISSIVSLPFLVGGMALAIIAAIFILTRMGKGLKPGGLIFSVISLLLSVWSFSLIVGAFKLLKAH